MLFRSQFNALFEFEEPDSLQTMDDSVELDTSALDKMEEDIHNES